jgi:hypothetical protein
MADSKITALTAISTVDPTADPLVIVDVSDTSMAASGTTKKSTINQLLGAGGTATLASATITGAATVGTTLGVTGVSTFAAGTLLLPALTTTGDTNTGIYFPAADTFAVTTGGAERYRVDSSGNVGVGLTPRAKLDVNGGLLVNNYTTSTNYAPLSVTTASTITTPSTFTNAINIWNPTTVGAYSNITFGYNALGLTNAPAYIGFVSTTSTSGGFGDLVFGTRSVGTDTAATERVRIDSSGNVGVGVTAASNTRTHFKGSSTSTDYITFCVNGSDKFVFGARNDGLLITGSSADSASLPNAPYNLTSGSAANVYLDSQGIFYRSTSSLKYKTDIADSTRGLSDVLKLRPVTYKAKNSGDTVFGGLIAEEVDAAGLTEFVQYAPDNTPDAIHYGNMVSLLVSAIKELSAEVNALKNA